MLSSSLLGDFISFIARNVLVNAIGPEYILLLDKV